MDSVIVAINLAAATVATTLLAFTSLSLPMGCFEAFLDSEASAAVTGIGSGCSNLAVGLKSSIHSDSVEVSWLID